MEDIKVEYKGIDITYNEHNNDWTCEIDVNARNRVKGSLKEAKERIDNFLKVEKAFVPHEALSTDDWYNGTKLGEKVLVTSEASDGEVWVNINGKRRKVSKSRYCKNIPENIETINKITKLRENISILQKEEKNLLAELIKID